MARTSCKPPREPRLPKHLEACGLAALDDAARVERCRLEACALASQQADRVRFDSVQIVTGTLDGSKLPNLSWLDVACERCNLSMVEARGGTFTRVVMQSSRITGGKFAECDFESVRFGGCQLDYASFADARCKQVVFDTCQLREADFRGADLRGTAFLDCDLTGADFSGAKLQDADISSCAMERITIGPADVRGLIVSESQAAAFARLFGMIVRG